MSIKYNVTNFNIAFDHPVAASDQGTFMKLCCRGVQIDATINVTHYHPKAGRKYEVGLVQRLDYSNQRALYEKDPAGAQIPGAQIPFWKKYKITKWEQRHLPVFDGNPALNDIFYDANSCATIMGTGVYNVTLKDYPTLVADKVDVSAKGNSYNLIRMLKYNRFHVFLIVRRSDAATHDGIWCDYLRDLEWATKVEASFDPNNNFAVIGNAHQDKSSSILPMQYLTAASPFRRNWNMYKKRGANTDQRVDDYRDALGILELKDFTIDRYMPVLTF
jgi:hypothetical protein